MKQLTCEMCGSTDLVKQDGVFVCQTCGMKYSVEEAKKMMIEGTVDVQGTVKVDKSKELAKLYILARRAREENNTDDAQKYYKQIREEVPNDWEAVFYTAYYNALNTTNGEISFNANKFENTINSLISIIKDMSYEERSIVIKKISEGIISLTNTLFVFAQNFYNTTQESLAPMLLVSPITARKLAGDNEDRLFDNVLNIISISYTYGKSIVENFPKEETVEYQALSTWKNARKIYATLVGMFSKKTRAWGKYEKIINETISLIDQEIRTLEPTYQGEVVEAKQGCYVATCVYGSYDCPQVWTLRRYRDNILALTWYGRAFIRTYYAISPTLVKWFGNTNWFKKMWKGKLDRMVKKLQDNGVESTSYEDKEW